MHMVKRFVLIKSSYAAVQVQVACVIFRHKITLEFQGLPMPFIDMAVST